MKYITKGVAFFFGNQSNYLRKELKVNEGEDWLNHQKPASSPEVLG